MQYKGKNNRRLCLREEQDESDSCCVCVYFLVNLTLELSNPKIKTKIDGSDIKSVHTHLYFAEKEGERARQHSVLMHIPFDLPRILGNARPTHLLPALSLSLLRSNVRVLLSQEKGGRQNGGREIKKIEFASSLNQAERTSLDNSKFYSPHDIFQP